MKVTDYNVRPISVDEASQLLGQGSQPVFLLLYSPESDRAPERMHKTFVSGSFAPSVAMSNDTNIREQMLANYLHQLGIPAHIRGYEYLKKAIEFSMENPAILYAITKELYPDIAKSCGSTAKNVERAIRHAIETAWDRGNLQLQEDLFGATANCVKKRPTNGEFIAVIAERFRFQQAE